MASANPHRNHPSRPATQAGGAGRARPPPPPPAPQYHGGGGRGRPPDRPANGPQQGAFPPIPMHSAYPPPGWPERPESPPAPAAPPRPLHNNYIEDPLDTFGCDGARVVCDICSETELVLSRPRTTVVDETPAILPCGHVFGLECLNKWLEIHSTCPSCRLELKHAKCGHKVGAGALNFDTVSRGVPRTIPRGGFITAMCLDCARSASKKEAERLADHVTLYIREVLPEHRTNFGEESYAKMVEMALEHRDRIKEVLRTPRVEKWW